MYLPSSILTLAAFALFGCDASGILQEKEVYPCQQDVKAYSVHEETEVSGAIPKIEPVASISAWGDVASKY